MVLQLLLAAILSFIFMISETISEHVEKYHPHFLSLGSGMFIALIFIEIFPLINKGVNLFGDIIFLVILGSFTFYHIIEKYTYQHTRGHKRKVELGYIHVVGFFIENFVNGFIMAVFIISGVTVLIFLPYVLIVVAISLPLKHLDDKFKLGNLKYVLSLSVFLGAVTASILTLSGMQFYLILSVITGLLLYFVVRDMIPKGSYGKPEYFLTGVVLVTLLLQVVRV